MALRSKLRLCSIVAVICLGVWLIFGAGLATAHANLVRSVPEANAVVESPPTELRLWFSEDAEPRLSDVQLLDSSGWRVNVVTQVKGDHSDSTLLIASLQPVPPGIYTAVWRTTSTVDGHVTTGSFAFVVGDAQAKASISPAGAALAPPAAGSTLGFIGALARWSSYLALALLAGGFAFFPLILQPSLRGQSTAPAEVTPETGQANSKAWLAVRPLVKLLWIGWGLSILAAMVAAIAQAATSSGVDVGAAFGSPLLTLLTGTRFGVIFFSRLLLLGLTAMLISLASRGREADADAMPWSIGLGVTTLLALMTALSSHAAATEGAGVVIAVAIDWLHILAASIWIGGLIALALLIPALRRLKPAIAGVVARFSLLATVCVVAIGLTGLFQAMARVGDPGNLFDNAYGTALIVKLGLVAPLLGLAALNYLLVKRRLAAQGDVEGGGETWRRRVQRIVGGEVIVVSLVLLVTSVLAGLQPARDAYVAGLVLRAQSPEVRAVLAVNPGVAGLNSFDVLLRNGSGQPIADAEKVTLTFTMTGHDMGESEGVATNAGGGHYVVRGAYVSMLAVWRVELLVRRPGLDDERLVFSLIPRLPEGDGIPAGHVHVD